MPNITSMPAIPARRNEEIAMNKLTINDIRNLPGITGANEWRDRIYLNIKGNGARMAGEGNSKPDASKHDPRPEYLRALLDKAGVSQRAAARRIGVSERVMRYYLANPLSGDYRTAPYPVQYALEQLTD